MQKNKKSKLGMVWCILISLFVLAIALLIGALTNFILSVTLKTSEPIEHIVGMLEGIIGAIATGLVLFQLRLGQKTEQHQNEIEKASFALQYNQAFIQDKNMTEVECLLENQVFYDKEPKEILNSKTRQKFINYLVYLESMAPLILSGVLSLDYIDNLMAYRFFLAIDNTELQEKEILPFAEYYRGCFKLYKIWKAYRDEHGLSCPKDNCKNKETMRSLSEYKHFEKFAA